MIRRFLGTKVVVAMVAGLVSGALLSGLQLSCGKVVQPTACAADECPAGPAGPTGPQGPAGPSLGSCHWLVTACTTPGAVECAQICPTGTYPVSGSCDAAFGATLSENRASTGVIPFPSSPAAFTAFDRWVCETASGDMQFTYALCCAP